MPLGKMFVRSSRTQNDTVPTEVEPAENRLTPRDRIALLDTFEAAGLGWFWATDS